eukprot:361411-Chlamydomonas_euryale.AAC.1
MHSHLHALYFLAVHAAPALQMLAAIDSAPEGVSDGERGWLEEKILDAVGEDGWYQMEEMAVEAETEAGSAGDGTVDVALTASKEWLQRMRSCKGPNAWCGDVYTPRWQIMRKGL